MTRFNKQSIQNTSLIKRLLKLAGRIALSRFRMLKLAAQAAYKLFHPETGRTVRGELKYQLQLLLRMLKSIATLQYRELPTESLVKLVAALLYFVLLADLIPDILPLIGFADDAVVIAWVYDSIREDLEAYEEWETTFAQEHR